MYNCMRQISSGFCVPKINIQEDAETPRDVPQVRNIAFDKACDREITFKDALRSLQLLLLLPYMSITSC